MSEDPTQIIDTSEVREGDILFDCPYCGKNLAIEAAGAGLMVPCVGCGKPVQVPIPDAATPEAPVAAVPRPVVLEGEDPRDTIRQLDEALAIANQQIDRLTAEKESLQERRAFLEQIRVTGAARLERIAAELATVQDALDRALVLLAEIRAEKPV
jgi:predicted  nucleic acid-binding Zn-ribbon protein